MKNWREGARAGHTHEPNDVTVQLDGLGRQLSELPVEPGTPDSSDGPVFVDESGRRSRTYRRLGWVLAVMCAVYAVTLVGAVLGGNSSAPWLPLSGQDEKEPADVRPVRTDPSGQVADAPVAEPSVSAAHPALMVSTVPSSSATSSLPARPSARISVSSSAPAPKDNGTDNGTVTKPADSEASSSPSADTSSPPVVVEPSPDAGESTSPPAASTAPPVQGQEGIQ